MFNTIKKLARNFEYWLIPLLQEPSIKGAAANLESFPISLVYGH